jgi:hypothetical protein
MIDIHKRQYSFFLILKQSLILWNESNKNEIQTYLSKYQLIKPSVHDCIEKVEFQTSKQN